MVKNKQLSSFFKKGVFIMGLNLQVSLFLMRNRKKSVMAVCGWSRKKSHSNNGVIQGKIERLKLSRGYFFREGFIFHANVPCWRERERNAFCENCVSLYSKSQRRGKKCKEKVSSGINSGRQEGLCDALNATSFFAKYIVF